jgi:PAS domain S-box-containing protein
MSSATVSSDFSSSNRLHQSLLRVLERLARGAPLEDVLEMLIRAVEAERPGMLASVLLLDAQSRTLGNGVAPSLPDFYNEAVEGFSIGPRQASCGAAAYLGRRVIVEDVLTHPNWRPIRDLARKAGLRACWSEPIRGAAGEILGTFAMYYRVLRSPCAADLELIESASHLAGVAIEHRRNQSALVCAKEEWEQTFDAIPDLIAIVDPEFRIQRVNRALAARLGVAPEQCIGDKCHRHFHGTHEPSEECPHLRALREGESCEADLHLDRLGGDFLVSASPLLDEDGKIRGSVHVAHDISEQKLAQRQLQAAHQEVQRLNAELEARVQDRTAELEATNERLREEIIDRQQIEQALRDYERIVEAVPVGIHVVDRDLVVRSWNRHLEDFSTISREQVIGKRLFDVLPPPESIRLKYEHVLSTGESFVDDEFESVFAQQEDLSTPVFVNLKIFPFRTNDKISGVCTMITDVTEKKIAARQTQQLQAELTHVSRLTTLGEMATGLAHELNQPLASLSLFAQSCVELTKRDGCICENLREPLDKITEQAMRASEIIRRLRKFVGQRARKRSTVDMNKLVRDVVELISHEARMLRIDIQLFLAEPAPLVVVDPIEIQQVLLNLLRNAMQSIDEHDCARRAMAVHVDPRDDKETLVRVCDTGPGLATEVSDTLFEPFVSTKPNGMGLGLSISRTIIEDHCGRIWAETSSDSGAQFLFTIPHRGKK